MVLNIGLKLGLLNDFKVGLSLRTDKTWTLRLELLNASLQFYEF